MAEPNKNAGPIGKALLVFGEVEKSTFVVRNDESDIE